MRSNPPLLHTGNPVVGENQRIFGKKFHLVGTEKQREPLGDVSDHFDVGEIPAAHQVGAAANLEVVLVHLQNDSYPGTTVTG